MEYEDSSDEEYSGIKLPGIINQLKRLLEQYSDDQILKELVQNAEDGGATEMKILYVKNEHQHPTSNISWKGDSIQFATKGPALCVYNNGVFSKTDWQGIAAIQCSTKENEPLKVGRFGLGFKSVFHITDHPLILSGKTLMVMNPQANYANEVVHRKRLKDVDAGSQKAMLRMMDGVFEFSSDVFQLGYNGTLFWFPLRVVESNISKVTYDADNIHDLFLGFKTIAPSILLFLKNIENIELYEQNCDKQTLLYRINISNESIDSIRTERRRFMKHIDEFNGNLAPSSLSSLIKLNIRSEGFEWLQERACEIPWLVMNHYHGNPVSSPLKALTDAEDWSYSPYVSVAVSLSSKAADVDGHIFCFLPLPKEGQSLTGLPVHVNGLFVLSQDRHHIKWTLSDQDTNYRMDRSVQWNMLLVTEVLPQVYANIFNELIEDADNSAQFVYNILPNPENVSETWMPIVDPVFKCLCSQRIIYTSNNNGEWVLPRDALILSRDSNEDILKSIEEVYLLIGKNVARIPAFVENMLAIHGAISYTSAEGLGVELNAHDGYIVTKMNRNQKINILRYFLNTDSTQLQELPLLPLADGSFTRFSNRSEHIVYICSEQEYAMFPEMNHHFIDLQTNDSIIQQLRDMAKEGEFQLYILQTSAVPSLIEKCIIKNEFCSKPLTTDSVSWLKSVWHYIGTNRSEIISNVSHLPLLPWQNKHNSKFFTLNCLSIMKSKCGVGTLETNLTQALEKLGVTIFTSIPEYIVDIVSGEFVQLPTNEGIFNCLFKIVSDEQLCRKSIIFFNDKANIREKNILMVKLSQFKKERIQTVRGLIRRLNLFSWADVGQVDTCLDDVHQIYDGTNELIIPIEPHFKILRCDDYSGKHLAEMCGAEFITFDNLVKQILSNLNDRYPSADRKEFMKFFLEHISYFKDKNNLMNCARNVKFVENRNGKYCKPTDLMDPNSEILQDLFHEEKSKFPQINTGIKINKLKKLGLISEHDIQDNEILKIACYIHDQCTLYADSITLFKKGRALCKLIQKYSKQFTIDTINSLITKSICPIITVRPRGYPINLPFAGESSSCLLGKACELYQTEAVNLIGGSKLVANEIVPDCFRKYFISAGEEIWSQLLLISSSFNADEYDKFIYLLTAIYDFLNTNNRLELPEMFKNERIVWTGYEGKFQKPQHVWIRMKPSDLHLKPYFYILPDILLRMEDLFQRIGCVDEQTENMLIRILHDIKTKHESTNHNLKTDVTTDLSLVIQIVNNLSTSPNDLSKVILLPIFTTSNDTLQLKPPSECTISNDGWLGDLVDDDVAPDNADTIFYVHDKIPRSTAEYFHVPLLTDRVLSNADEFDVNFGQNEPLTKRLRTILKDYTDGFSIPKEIIQNADDAGASVVKFMYDERTLSEAQTCLFNDGMLPCQGPAFLAFNDAQFHPEDFDNITRLAGETKKHDSMTIGRFGLGFNSVYNLTDVPSFISGETYVIFDPHQSHIKRCGLKVNLNSPRNYMMRRKMKGQFYPFEGIFDCKVLNKDDVAFTGTLFRFPLRSQDEASKSEIKDLCYSKSDMKEFVRKLEEGAGNLLLFTQNIIRIELYHLTNGEKPHEAKLLMQVSKSSDHSSGTVLQYFNGRRSSQILDNRDEALQLVEKIEIRLSITTFSKVFCGMQTVDCLIPFLISWSFGKNKSLEAAKQTEFQGLLPIAATAVLTDNNLNSVRKPANGFYHTAHLFCFLPLPITSLLPVHINAPFAVKSNRRELTWKTEDDIYLPDDTWNRIILEDACSQAYILMLQTLASQLSAEKYFALWPGLVCAFPSQHDQILSMNIYRTISTEEYHVFPSKDAVVTLSNAVFLHHELRGDTAVGTIAFKALQYFLDIGRVDALNDGGGNDVYLVDLPTFVSQQFQHAKCGQHIIDRSLSIEDFYTKIVFPYLSHPYWTKEDLDELILYCLLNGNNVIQQLVSSYTCIPTEPNGLRKQPMNLVHPRGKIAKLFLAEEECFPQGPNYNKFCSPKALLHLSKLGMQENDLQSDQLPERIKLAVKTKNTEVIIERCEHLFRYMCLPDKDCKKKYELCPDNIRDQIGKVPFLPKKTIQWQFPVYKPSNPCPFIAPQEGHLPELLGIIGCTLPIVDNNNHEYTEILKWLGVKDDKSNIDVQSVLKNITTMINHYIDSEIKHELYEDLEKSLGEMYSYLCSVIKDGIEETLNLIINSLYKQPVILHGKTLMLPEKMIMNLSVSVEPYLYCMEMRYQTYEPVFNLLGVLPTLTPHKIIEVLLVISKEKSDDELSLNEIDCIVTLSNEFSKFPDPMTSELMDELRQVKLPSEDRVLMLCEDLCFDDSPWLNNSYVNSLKHLHKSFSPNIAESLGVKSKRSIGFDSVCSDIHFTNFGQHEDLTNRIKCLLEGYPSNESILKEMLQNADDAGATEVWFIKDFRDLSKNSLPDDRLAAVQGPALCIYNNSFFTHSDLQGIQDIGIGSKKDDMMTTGQYGVGFNVVYHVTDVPSFWSKGGDVGEVICIFDPHCKYLSQANSLKPGIKIEAAGLQDNFPDFMDGYLPNFTQKLPRGTLFRLPLRTKKLAEISAITHTDTTVKHIIEIVNLLKEQLFACMLFLENIKTVKIGTVLDGEINIEYEVNSTMTKSDEEKQMNYNKHLQMLSDKIEVGQIDAFNSTSEVAITVHIEDRSSDRQVEDTSLHRHIEDRSSDRQVEDTSLHRHIEDRSSNRQVEYTSLHREDYLVIKRAGFLDSDFVQGILYDACQLGKVKRLPRGGVAINLKAHVDGISYCTLPLPVLTGLPVHINGQFALDHESRRNICKNRDSISGLWNTQLRNSLIVPAYISALKAFKEYPTESRKVNTLLRLINEFENLFPKIEEAKDEFWKGVAADVYSSMAIQHVRLFPVVSDKVMNWCDIDWVAVQTDGEFRGCFSTLTDHFSYECKAKMENILIKLGMKVLKSSRLILNQFTKANIDVQLVSPNTVRTFIKSFSRNELKHRCNLGELPALITETSFETVSNLMMVVNFVIQDIDADGDDGVSCLYDTPLLLRQNNKLEIFDEQSTVIVSAYCDLFQQHSSQFLSEPLVRVMEKFVKIFKPLKEWSLDNFATLFRSTDTYSCLCQDKILDWDLELPVGESWLFKIWKFIHETLVGDSKLSKNETLVQNKTKDDSKTLTIDSRSYQLLKGFSILPVTTATGEYYLYPLSYSNYVMYYDSTVTSNSLLPMRDILCDLNMPMLVSKPEDFSDLEFRTLKDTVARIDDPNSILEVLLNNLHCKTRVDNKIYLDILKYFDNYITDVIDKNKIRTLEMFETHDGSLVSLSENTTCLCLDDDVYPQMPTDGLKHWGSVSRILILRYHPQLLDLYGHISIKRIDIADLYSVYILPKFYCFQTQHHISHLKYIRDTLLCSVNATKRKNLILQLKSMRFIPHYDGTMKKASDYFDHTQEVFTEMHGQFDFVPDPFNNRGWYKFLVLAGLVIDVTVDMFVGYVRTVEQSARLTNTNKVLQQSRVLCNHLFSRERLCEEGICERIKGIRFVECVILSKTDFRSKIRKQCCSVSKLIAFEDSYLERNLDYIWTVASVIQELPSHVETHYNKERLQHLLGIKSKVKVSHFLQHFKNICETLKDQKRVLDITEKLLYLFDKLYSYIGKECNVADMTSIQSYFTIYLPEEMRMVKASRIILSPLPGELIKDHIFKGPLYFGKYFNVFELLGARASAVPEMYLEVLQNVYGDCGNAELDPNESLVVKTSIQQLNRLWNNISTSEKQDSKVPVLYLPSDKGILTPSTDLIFMDNNFINERTSGFRFKYFIGFDALEMYLTDPIHSLGEWPNKYKMKRLSQLVKECLKQDCCVTDGYVSTEVKYRLGHKYMSNALIRLLRHMQDKYSLPRDTDECLETKIQAITYINIREVEELRSELTYREQTVAGSEQEQIVFISEDADGRETIFVDKDISCTDIKYDLLPVLVSIVNRILCVDIIYFTTLWEMIKDDPGGISRWLDKRNIRASGFITSRPSLIPLPGTIIPLELHWMLDNSFSVFDEDDYVGYEVFDPDLTDDDTHDYRPVYIFAKIITVLHTETETDFARYRINVGSDAYRDVNTTQIYKFLRRVESGLMLGENTTRVEATTNTVGIDIILMEIRDKLKKVWNCSDIDRKRVIKRLLLRWHPDKNPDNITLATEITQIIFKYIGKLSLGLQLGDYDNMDTTDGNSAFRTSYSAGGYGNFYSKMHSRGTGYAHYSESHSDNSFYSSAQYQPNTMPDEAARWLSQAKCDLKAAELSLSYGDTSHNWICYKCQQAGEKALKAVWYIKDPHNVTRYHNLRRVAAGLDYPDLVDLASQLQSTVGEHTRMRYPDTLSYPNIPNDVYDISHSTKACQLTGSIISRASEIVGV